MYYGIITLSALMFSLQFFFTEMFRKEYGNDLKAMLVSSAGGAIVGIIVLSVINGFSLGFSWFSLFMAILVALNNMGFTFFSLKSLGKINLSLYSVFSMLGGMALPFIAGILFYNEALTAGKVLCFVFIAIALFLTVEKGEKKSGAVYYAGIFILNGMAGVLSKIYNDAPFAKIPASEYSVLCAIVALVISLIFFPFCKGTKRKLGLKSVVAIAGNGILSRVANYLLLICLAFLPASAQYPFITGGTMIFSTAICFFTDKKPTKKEILAVLLSFVGILFLVLIP